MSFNPRARMGRDVTVPFIDSYYGFQSTRPHGARPLVVDFSVVAECFNPRARMGRDVRQFYLHRLPRSFNPRARMGRD